LQQQALIAALEQGNTRLATACRLYLANHARNLGRPEVGLEQAKVAHANGPREAAARVGQRESSPSSPRSRRRRGSARPCTRCVAFFEASSGIGEGDATVHLALARALQAPARLHQPEPRSSPRAIGCSARAKTIENVGWSGDFSRI